MPGKISESLNLRYLGLDIGGTKTALLLADRKGCFYHREEFPTETRRGFESVYRDIRERLIRLLESPEKPCSIGVSIGGPLDPKEGVVFSPPNLPDWDRIPLKAMLRKDTGLPVKVMHDAKAGALAEWWYGAGQGSVDMIFLTFGTGLGCGVICDGRLLETIPGEVGHWGIGPLEGPLVYGRNNAWEGVCSGAGIAALASKQFAETFPPGVTARQVIEAARKGSNEGKEILAVVSDYLGKGIALLADLFSPQKVILGSLAIRAGDQILPRAIEVFRREAHPSLRNRTEILPGMLGERIGDYGALCAALYGQQSSF